MRKLNDGLQASSRAKGMVFNEPDTEPFRAALSAAGFYAEWREKIRRRGLGPAGEVRGRARLRVSDQAQVIGWTAANHRRCAGRALDRAFGWRTEVPGGRPGGGRDRACCSPACVRALRASTAPLIWSDELASILFLWLAMLGAVIALRRGEHMRLTAWWRNRAGRWRNA